MNQKSISVVIPNYNGRKLLEENLPSVYKALEYCKAEYEIIIADDCSTDDSVAFLKDRYPEIILLINEVNKGFSPTINLGIKAATKDLVFALNNDVMLTPEYFVDQFRYFDSENTFGVMGKIIGLTDHKTQDTAKYPYIKGATIKGTINYSLENSSKSFWIPSFFLSGANSLVDRKKLFTLGGFDEIYAPFYNEDLDLGIKAWRLGWKCYYEPEAVCLHPNSATISKYHKSKKIKVTSFRNKVLLHLIHLEGLYLFLYNIQLFFNLALKILSFKFYYITALNEVALRKKDIAATRMKINELGKFSGTKKSLPAVVKEIRRQLSGKKIIKF
ncbi:glycosyltransferase family 2 protein [Sporocytophaga myxococcoides]|uniref:glycosyltransferase family 2 protein n=1 Tax=Sporocytophaga myxococcoides TaxID=153721 RepID=UPI000403A436|nr:glycosyltransferase family 2 protein [Sporocytophaga myxococcoides]